MEHQKYSELFQNLLPAELRGCMLQKLQGKIGV